MVNRNYILMIAFALGACLEARSQFSPLYVGTKTPIIDQLGSNVPNGAEVHFYESIDGIIHEPDYDGNAHINNVLLGKVKIGEGVDPFHLNSGKFSSVVKPRPYGLLLFARVISKGFYSDSRLHLVPSDTSPIFFNIPNIIYPTDFRDFDQDGLINSWEKTYGTDLNSPDTDGDLLSDFEEICLKTNPNDSNDFLKVYGLHPFEEDMVLTWEAREGVEYIVEQSTDYLEATNATWSVVDVGSLGSSIITNSSYHTMLRIRANCP